MKIIIDDAVSFAEEAFSQFGEVELKPGREITNSRCKSADALITRSITDVNETLLAGTKVKFVGTATIGTDHIDLNYLKKKGISFASAAGCNADAVAEYFFVALFELLIKYGLQISDLTLGVVGCGNIGSRVVRFGEAAGFNVLVNDPPLKRKTGSSRFLKLDDVLQSDIITFHVPLNIGGADNTYHLIEESKLKLIKDGAIIINAARGPVIDNSDLMKYIQLRRFKTVLDVWESEPNINVGLLQLTEFGTPHIAGYSYEGKVNGTKMIYDAFCNYLDAPKTWTPVLTSVEKNLKVIEEDLPLENSLHTIFSSIYDIKNDDKDIRTIANIPNSKRSFHFDKLRKNYNLRREFSNYNINLIKKNDELEKVLNAFRFNVMS
ncbi:MAG: 4-phosphoerythronate dehydrogenase [Ignavibacteriaceae bacterium]|nr:4-phosphoerythronate dehydrogenase [Ignavibacteriaceae bacterium]